MSHKTFPPQSAKSPQFPSLPVLWEWSGHHLSSLVRAINLTLTIFQGNKVVGLFLGGILI